MRIITNLLVQDIVKCGKLEILAIKNAVKLRQRPGTVHVCKGRKKKK
jgi:hypothetical protein